MKKKQQRLLLNLLAYSVLAIALYYVFFQKETQFGPAQTLNASAVPR